MTFKKIDTTLELQTISCINTVFILISSKIKTRKAILLNAITNYVIITVISNAIETTCHILGYSERNQETSH